MNFASDNTSGAAPEIIAAVASANEGHSPAYGADDLMRHVTQQIRSLFEAPEASVHLVATGTAANALSLAVCCPVWGAIFCHPQSHIQVDECGAPEFYTGGAKLVLVPGDGGKMTPAALGEILSATGQNGVHSVMPGAVSLSNVTEAGTVYTPAEIAAVASLARQNGIPCHMDGARFANAVAATDASPADMSWRAGVDVLSFGGTKNGCMGVEAVVIFDGSRAREFELRRKRAGHLFSKHRFLSAQMAAYLEDGLWLDLARRANRSAAYLARGLARHGHVRQSQPVEANMMFPEWPAAVGDRLRAAGASFKAWPLADAFERARLVTSWNTTEQETDAFVGMVATV